MNSRALAADLLSCDPDRAIAVRFAPSAYRSMLTFIVELDCDLAKALRRAHEPPMQRIRMQFWRDALASEDGAGLPLAQAFRSEKSFELCTPLLNDLIDAHDHTIGFSEQPNEIIRNYVLRQSLLFRLGSTLLAETATVQRTPDSFFDKCGQVYGETIHLCRSSVGAEMPVTVRREKVISLTNGMDNLRPLLADTPVLIRPALLPLALVSTYLMLFQKADPKSTARIDVSPFKRAFLMWWAARAGF